MKRVLLWVAVLGFLIQLTGWAAAQPAVSSSPRMPNGGDIPAAVQVCYNYTTAAFQYCPYVTGSSSSSGSSGTYNADGGLNTHVTNFPATQPVSGSVSVSNFPATQPVSGTVGVNNFPSVQPVSGTIADSNSAPYQGAVALTSGTADTAYRRSIGFTCTGSGTLILATADGTSATIDIIGSAALQYAPWSVNTITVGTATGCTRLLNIK